MCESERSLCTSRTKVQPMYLSGVSIVDIIAMLEEETAPEHVTHVLRSEKGARLL